MESWRKSTQASGKLFYALGVDEILIYDDARLEAAPEYKIEEFPALVQIPVEMAARGRRTKSPRGNQGRSHHGFARARHCTSCVRFHSLSVATSSVSNVLG